MTQRIAIDSSALQRSIVLIRVFLAGLFVSGSVLAPLVPVHAAAWEASLVARDPGSTLQMDPGGTAMVRMTFRNLGTTPWTNYDKRFVSIYTYAPKYRQSLFRDASWLSDSQPVRLTEEVVGPGNDGTIAFRMTAPQTPGVYEETFALAAEDAAWIVGGQFTIRITVGTPAVAVTPIATPPAAAVPAPAIAPAPVASSAKPAAPVVAPKPAAAPKIPAVIKVAANAPQYAAAIVARLPSSIEVAPGKRVTVSLNFRNVGSTAWKSTGPSYVSVYTYGPKYRKSVFQDKSWLGPTQPVKIAEVKVTPGTLASAKITLTAPAKTGTYVETFALAAEGTSWIPGGQFSLPIVVTKTPYAPTVAAPIKASQTSIVADGDAEATPPIDPATQTGVPPAVGYRATMLLVSARSLDMTVTANAGFRVGFKNVGKTPWSSSGDTSVVLVATTGDAPSFHHSSWPDATTAVRMTGDTVLPGQLAFFDFTLAAPSAAGSYLPRFMLTAGGAPIEGGTIDIPVGVTQGVAAAGEGAPAPSGPRGPEIRVGLFDTRDTVLVAADGQYGLIDGASGSEVRKLTGTTGVTYDFAAHTYTVRNGSYEQVFTSHVLLRPDDPSATIFQIPSYSSIASWDSSVNFNRFRGDIEVHYSAATDKLWVIEHVPLEDYMRGLGETSNGSPYEFQKALVTAARTFAYYVVSLGGKHQSEFYDVRTDGGDQVYKGYTSELVRPNVVRAVEETRGTLATYQGDVAVTPYFSRSDGRTRSWSEVWYGDRPWLIGKPAPYDVGKTLWGHGVGMSASDAVGRAADGASWQDILKYYYTGIDLQVRY